MKISFSSKKRAISALALSTESEAWITLHPTLMAKSPRMDPASACRALVIPVISRTASTTSSPSRHKMMTGEFCMKLDTPGKKGWSAMWA